MKETYVSDRYARALFGAVGSYKSGSLETALGELVRLQSDIYANAELAALLRNPLIAVGQKRETFLRSLGVRVKDFSPFVINFLSLLVVKKRVELLPLIIKKFTRLVEESKGAVKAYVKSASALSDEQRKKIEAKLEAWLQRKVTIDASVNPELLAGVVVQVGDQVLDNSLRFKMKGLKNILQS